MPNLMPILGLCLVMLAASASAQDQAAATRAIDLAQSRYEQSQALGFAWVATAQRLRAAREALAGGQAQQAAELAGQAQSLADASIAQAERESVDWRTRSPMGVR